jgi:hypothetical protein
VSGRAILRLRARLSAGSGVAGIRLKEKRRAATLTRKNAVDAFHRTEPTLPIKNQTRKLFYPAAGFWCNVLMGIKLEGMT